MSSFINSHPLITMGLYVLFCILAGVSVFFIYSFIRNKIEIKRKMKGRVNIDKSR